MSDSQYFAGIDIGASAVKVIIINKQREIASQAMHKSGVDLIASSQNALDEAKNAIKPAPHITQIVSTGFGRNNLTFTQGTITEISAHSKGVYYYFPKAVTIIDEKTSSLQRLPGPVDGNRAKHAPAELHLPEACCLDLCQQVLRQQKILAGSGQVAVSIGLACDHFT